MEVFRQLFPKVMVGHFKDFFFRFFSGSTQISAFKVQALNLMKAQNNWKLVVNLNSIAIWMFCFNIAVTSEIAGLDYAWLNTCS